MNLTRRAVLAGAAALPAISKVAAAEKVAPAALPAKAAFARMPMTYLDAGSTHPMSLGAKAALEEYLRYKTQDGSLPGYSIGAMEKAVIESFGRLIGAQPDELCFVQSTTMGENLVLQALGFPQAGARIVTDVLHFFGSFYTYGELGKAGMDVVTLPMTSEGRIDMAELEKAVNSRTRLVSISLVSTINGFQHDLKRVCDIAHAHGAYVYADVVHAAGTVPTDLRASGVDFAACSSYKWLMGDFGLGFLYVRREVQDKIRRPWWGYHQLASFRTHVFPFDEPGAGVASYTSSPNTAGRFAMGTTSWTGVVHLNHSLSWLEKVGVAQIQTWRQPMIDTLQKELRARGYQPLTPLESKTSMVAFALKDARAKLAEPLKAANVRITLSQHRFRVSVAVFNDMNDIDRLLDVLPKRAS
ncbi:aminotransferase class V-fold PLP-dependent enzyme [Steroidobacter sp. S1-65]|uniref:Aminotransferase class V-fold PLP-dependent enzyme n=1 Tax=Steroidobacter gossypii TaxID=2805490 RepID=A0ABS1X4J4_9GAMM|nr:aminotransferase class V-fold PLP-dependent enzyme [Steroidobacter gossypii]MBM0108135.1 aminotransferase class V-fold PLP-dependent enzyme [Steroidobacter gossypii]